ncbi:MAG: imidazole glycerol phosphate synthase subunit HisF [Thermoleophilaceae bacterium]|nr:imidazole glycerol phosphate synthase subunit HisF [Thermoleophilaceae bacterium]
MRDARAIPCLLLRDGGLYKTTRFGDAGYVGDPINTARIFSDKQVDELVLLDIDASGEGRGPDLAAIASVAEECFAPLCYGGGIRSVEDMHAVYSVGVEKVSLNALAVARPETVTEGAARFGTQSVVVSIDVKDGEVVTHGATRRTGLDPVEHARDMAARGAGEILLTAVDREGTGAGFDLDLVRSVTGAVNVPVIAHGGAGSIEDLGAAVREGGASAVAAGSLFVYIGPHRAVLITYPEERQLEEIVG